MASQRSKALLYSALHFLAAGAVYRHLITGGWLTNIYHLNDPNIVNLILAVFEPIAVAAVLVYWLRQTPFFYRLISILALLQLLIAAGFLIFFLLFLLFWHPKLM